MYCFPNFEPVPCSMSSFNCCFLTCILVSQEAAKVVWYCYLLQNFPQFIVVHMVKGFSMVNEAEVDVFWNSLAFSMIHQMLAIWSLVPLSFLNPAFTSGSSWFMLYWSLTWRILSITLMACQMSAVLQYFERSLAFSFFGIGMKTDFPVLSLHSKWMGKRQKQQETIFLGSKITVNGDCSHNIKRCLFLGEKLW